jgi:hypothetical protein
VKEEEGKPEWHGLTHLEPLCHAAAASPSRPYLRRAIRQLLIRSFIGRDLVAVAPRSHEPGRTLLSTTIAHGSRVPARSRISSL